ncbi:FAD-dependent monooxygenase OpS4 [Paramyrothecium foliicola]|nr:FAD-dependent monooxygenase OpS4 [Paramyrothecium foliicola]
MYYHPKSPIQLDIIIVGAGLSGLASAVAARLSGHHVTVFESAKELREVGAGLQVTPNASKILQQWGLPDSLWASAAEPTSLIVHRYSGKILAMEDNFDKKMRKKYGAPFIDLHRVDLQLSLYERAKELGVKICLGEKVEHIDFDESEIICASGLKASADLIVGADGLWSRCRNLLLGRNDPPRPTGDLAYRIVLNLDDITDGELRLWVKHPAVHFWIGPGAHAAGYSLKAGKMYNIVLLVPDNLPKDTSRQAGSVEEMLSLFEGWDPILTRFLHLVDNVEKWKLMNRDELESWVNDQSNFVFVGDACHPMLPYLAQGANSAIEDGAVLGLLLGRIRSKDQLHQALHMYQSLRKARGEAIVKETFKQRDAFHMPDGPFQEERDRIFLSQLGKEITTAFPSRWTCPKIQPWLYGYDAWKEVEEAVREKPAINMTIPLLSLPPQERTNYIIDQLEGERITIPGSKGVFRILASSKQTNGGIAVFQSGAVLSDAPGFHWHDEAHDVFLVTKGFLKLYNGDKCRILGPGDFAYVPPKIIHNPVMTGPHTELLGLIAPGDWVDFFRYVSETHEGVILPENDDRDLKSILIPKVMAAKDRFDVHFSRDYQAPDVAEWEEDENELPGPLEPYFLRANTGPRWLLGGVLSRPFIHASQCSGKFAISSIESSKIYDHNPFSKWLTFENVDHCLCVQEGLLSVSLKGTDEWATVREGQTLVLAAKQSFRLAFASRYVRFISFTNGEGIEELVRSAGTPYSGFVLPDEVESVDVAKLKVVGNLLGIRFE